MEIYLEGGGISNGTGYIFQNQFRDWSISSAVIEAELSAYFPQNQIGQKWDNFVNLTNSFYSITPLKPELRIPYIEKIQIHM